MTGREETLPTEEEGRQDLPFGGMDNRASCQHKNATH